MDTPLHTSLNYTSLKAFRNIETFLVRLLFDFLQFTFVTKANGKYNIALRVR